MSQSGNLEHVHLTLDRTGGKSLGFSICQYDFQSTALALFVEDVVAGGIAANTEMIYDGDQIMKINGTSVDSFFDYDAAMDAITSSTKVQFELKPDDELPDYGSGIAKLLAASTKRSMSKPKRRSSVSSRAAAVAGGGGLGAHTGKFTPSTTTSTTKKKKKKAICLYDYTPDAGVDDELAFAKGDVLDTLEEIDEDGFVLAAHIQGTNKGKPGIVTGMTPSNFLKFLEDVVIERPSLSVGFGLQLVTLETAMDTESEKTIVGSVEPGSPADGILEEFDDVIIVNGKLLRDLTHDAAVHEMARSLKIKISVARPAARKKGKKAVALYDYTPDKSVYLLEQDIADGLDDELAFVKGDVLEMLEEIDQDGFVLAAHIQGTNKGKRGMAPSNFLNFLEDVVIERPSTSVGFGFGLGEKESGEMIISSIASGSPSDGILQSLDEVICLNGKLMRDLTHSAAVKEISRVLKLSVRVARPA